MGKGWILESSVDVLSPAELENLTDVDVDVEGVVWS